MKHCIREKVPQIALSTAALDLLEINPTFAHDPVGVRFHLVLPRHHRLQYDIIFKGKNYEINCNKFIVHNFEPSRL